MRMQIASASGNVFGYFRAEELPASFEGPRWARVLCPRGTGFGLDGIFTAAKPEPGRPWVLEHWDLDGAYTFCSNGSRAAMGLEMAPAGPVVETISSGCACLLRREEGGIAIRMPEGEGMGLKPLPFPVEFPAGFGFIGNPQLVLRVPSVEEVDLDNLAPPLRHHAALPGGTNVNIVEVLTPGEARIRSWERGVEGETLSCGTGTAVSAAWLAREDGPKRWTFHNASGDPITVDVDWASEGAWRELWLSGPLRMLGNVDLDPSLGL